MLIKTFKLMAIGDQIVPRGSVIEVNQAIGRELIAMHQAEEVRSGSDNAASKAAPAAKPVRKSRGRSPAAAD